MKYKAADTQTAKDKRIADASGIDSSEVDDKHRAAYDAMIAAEAKATGGGSETVDDLADKLLALERKMVAAGNAPGGYTEPDPAEAKFAPGEVEKSVDGSPAYTKPTVDLFHRDYITGDPEKMVRSKWEADQIKDFHAFNDRCCFLEAVLSDGGRRIVNVRETAYWKRWVKSRGDFGRWVDTQQGEVSHPDYMKATFTTTTGGDYLPTILSSDFTMTMRHQLSAAAAIKQFPMSTKVHNIPGEGADVVVYPAAEGATVTQSDTDDRKTTLTAVDIKARSKFTDDVAEDAILDVWDWHRNKHATNLGEAIEFAVIHGDTDDTQNQASNTTMTQYRMAQAWNGIHAQGISANTAEIAVGGEHWDAQDALDQLDALDTYAQPGKCVWLVHPSQHWRMRLMVDYQSTGYRNLLLVPGGAVNPASGEPADDVLGFPVLKSGQVAKNNSTTGYYDGSTTDRTQVYLFATDAFVLGDLRAITFETDKDIASGVIEVVTTWRGAMACLYATTEDCVSVAINVLPTTTPG